MESDDWVFTGEVSNNELLLDQEGLCAAAYACLLLMQLTEKAMRRDPMYSSLFAALEDALGSFDKSKDWPDFIKFLKNVQRVTASCTSSL